MTRTGIWEEPTNDARCILFSEPYADNRRPSADKSSCIVIIDDDPVTVAFLQDTIEAMELGRVAAFTSSAAALDWCRKNDTDLILVDYMMPPPDGLNFITCFRRLAEKEEIPIIMISGDEERKVRHRALELGANDFLTKPFDTHELLVRSKNMLTVRKRQKSLSSCAHHLANEVRRATAGLMKQEQETIFLLCRAAELRDPDTGTHLQRMSSYSRIIAANLGMSEQEQELVYLASPLHDIGKVAVPDDILQKNGTLDADEFAMITRHTLLGHEILRESSSPILQYGAQIALTHHEKYDGSGYPHRLAGYKIPLPGRIAAVADVFDALTSQRPYKQRWDIGTAAVKIRSMEGGHFDPECVAAFFDGWDEILAIHEQYRC